eukprot:scaffold233763_cov24-Tisochrysis_lutea.AAC.1
MSASQIAASPDSKPSTFRFTASSCGSLSMPLSSPKRRAVELDAQSFSTPLMMLARPTSASLCEPWVVDAHCQVYVGRETRLAGSAASAFTLPSRMAPIALRSSSSGSGVPSRRVRVDMTRCHSSGTVASKSFGSISSSESTASSASSAVCSSSFPLSSVSFCSCSVGGASSSFIGAACPVSSSPTGSSLGSAATGSSLGSAAGTASAGGGSTTVSSTGCASSFMCCSLALATPL